MSAEQLFLRQYVPISAYKPRMYLNGFPKAGLHLLELTLNPLIMPSTVGTGGSQWLGTFKWHSWTNEWLPIRRFLWRMSCLERGNYLMGHCGYHEDIERLLWCANIGHIFVYRDLRDVAVSQAHHIMDMDKPNLQHEHKDLYHMLGSFDATLSAVISGLGPYPGVVERWKMYAPWLESENVLCIKFEEMRESPEISVVKILKMLLNNATELLEGGAFKCDIDEETFKKLTALMVDSGKQTHLSTTFRKGKVGGWREEFTDEHIKLFKKSDKKGWLVKLGYETSEDWQ